MAPNRSPTLARSSHPAQHSTAPKHSGQSDPHETSTDQAQLSSATHKINQSSTTARDDAHQSSALLRPWLHIHPFPLDCPSLRIHIRPQRRHSDLSLTRQARSAHGNAHTPPLHCAHSNGAEAYVHFASACTYQCVHSPAGQPVATHHNDTTAGTKTVAENCTDTVRRHGGAKSHKPTAPNAKFRCQTRPGIQQLSKLAPICVPEL